MEKQEKYEHYIKKYDNLIHKTILSYLKTEHMKTLYREDLYQESCIGIMQACDRLEEGRDGEFAYFLAYIKKNIIDYFKKVSLIRIPSYLYQPENKDKLSSLPKVVDANSKNYGSFDTDFDDDWSDNNLAFSVDGFECGVIRKLQWEKVSSILRKHLKKQQYIVLEEYYFKNKTYKDISESMGVTRQRIEQVRKKAEFRSLLILSKYGITDSSVIEE